MLRQREPDVRHDGLVGEVWARRWGHGKYWGTAAVVVAGAASGLLGTATSIGGPPMALVWHGSSRARMRGTMSAFFLVGAVMALVALTAVGSIDRRTVLFAAALLPAMVLGFAVSGAVNARINRRIVRQVGLGASALGAVLVLLQAL